MTFQEILDETRVYLDDDSSARFSDEELKAYINISYETYYSDLIERSYRRILKTSELVFTDGVAAIPSDFYLANMLYNVEGSERYPITFYINHTGIEGQNAGKSYYTFEGEYFRLNNIKDGTYLLSYYPFFTPLSLDGDEPASSFLQPWHKLLAINAAIIGKAGREEDNVTGLEKIRAKIEHPYINYWARMSKGRTNVQPFYI
ncbi:MAG: hypothetical protein B6226_05855 [Candidatus Cloacimonetes bacterium 4572_65]|nr:MAG: hypothetical protein B6226_05855 [Candidatus Cloacimonetes bacterium 4572_65]